MEKDQLSLADVLCIPCGVTAVIGAGGKSTLIARLAQELVSRGKVIVTTTTHIWPPDMPIVKTGSPEDIKRAFESAAAVCAGTDSSLGKLGPPVFTVEELKTLADYVLVEADGARGLPLKAHAEYEPVIPPCADAVLQVIGADGLFRPIREAAHRNEIYAEALQTGIDHTVAPEDAARLLLDFYPVIINKASGRREEAAALASLLHTAVVTELFAPSPVLEIWRDGICLYS